MTPKVANQSKLYTRANPGANGIWFHRWIGLPFSRCVQLAFGHISGVKVINQQRRYLSVMIGKRFSDNLRMVAWHIFMPVTGFPTSRDYYQIRIVGWPNFFVLPKNPSVRYQ